MLNCSQILQTSSAAPSGFYKILAPNGSLISVYCNMEGSNCDGSWMRVGYLNMSSPGATCLPGTTLRQFNNMGHGLCGWPMSSSITYSAHGLHYSKVCGQIRGYQYNSPDGFPPLHNSFRKTAKIENCMLMVLLLLMAVILINISGLMLVAWVRNWKTKFYIGVHVILEVMEQLYL